MNPQTEGLEDVAGTYPFGVARGVERYRINRFLWRMTDPAHPIRVEARYIFPYRQVFETYLAQHAPGLRNEGLKRFPASLGIHFERTVGHVF